MLTTVQGDKNDIWILVHDRVVMYIDSKGTVHLPDDLIAFSKIPPLPQ